ncbi:MAG: ATP-binding protein [Verrucomicrobiota bacterium]
MKSIHKQLLVSLLVGLGFVLALAGTAVYFSVRESLVSQVDSNLRDASQWVRKVNFPLISKSMDSSLPAGPAFRQKKEDDRWKEFEDPLSGYYYEIHAGSPALDKKSPSLEDQSLPDPPPLRQDQDVFATATTPNGATVRMLSTGLRLRDRIDTPRKGGKSGKNRNATVVVAYDLSNVQQTLSKVLGGILFTGLATAGASAFLVITTLRRGLRPLQHLGDEVSAIDAAHLKKRFSTEAMPTELLPIANRLNNLLARLETSFEKERRFSSDIAHELRTPIAEIKMIAEVALQWPDQRDPQKFDDIVEVTGRMEAMTETLLALARWEQGGAKLRGDDVPMAELTTECWEPWQARALERSLDVEIGVSDSLRMHADRDMLRHILGNLISNAVEYAPEQGSVVIGTVKGSDGKYVGVSVANSVDDITEEDVGNLFDRFWRRDPSRESESGHSGLGLSLAKACAEALRLDLSAFIDGPRLRFDLTERSA